MKKGRAATVLLVAVFLAGLGLVVYPTASNYWNVKHQTVAIAKYVEFTESLQHHDQETFLKDAEKYNRNIAKRENVFLLSDEERAEYERLLDMTGTGIMGYVEVIPIGIILPIYHGTDDAVLQIAAGHLEWSSLPIGGLGTHCVLSGHRGLPGAKLFTDLSKVVVGDVFVLSSLNETLTYEVDQILTVEPDNTAPLQIEDGRDLCTLVTCTPYGINSHRLLVRGHRIENAEEAVMVHVTADAIQIEPMLVTSVLGIAALVTQLMLAFISGSKKGSGRGDNNG